MKHTALPLLLVVSLGTALGVVRAADEPATKPADTAKPAVAKAAGIEGLWTIRMDGPNGQGFKRDMLISRKGDALQITLKSVEMKAPEGAPGGGGSFTIPEQQGKDADFKDGVLTFAIDYAFSGQTGTIKHKATLKGDTLEGELEGGFGTMPFKATRAGEAPTGITGTWKLSVQMQNRTLERDLVLTQKGDAVTGTLKAPTNLPADANANFRPTDQEIKDGTLKGDVLTFSITRERSGQTFTTSYKGTLKGDTLEGDVTTPRGTSHFVAKRLPAADPMGQWDLSIVTPDRTYTPKITLSKGEGKLNGVMLNEDGSVITMKSVSVTGKTVKFHVDVPMPSSDPLALDFEGTVDGDTLKGTCHSTFGDSAFTGKKAKAAAKA
ncbi:MAG TPA: hypothetical protein VGN26_23160 [Armatimonadota bacterium]